MADKPAHVVEISESLGRTVDKAREGKIPAPPIEAFMSQAALDAAEAAIGSKAAPVHAEDLRPISRAEAARRTTFNGETLPRVPTTRRVIPAPFRRPRINGGAHGKTWQNVRADQVAEGDIVPDVGLVVAAGEIVLHSPRRDFVTAEQAKFLTADELDAPVASGTRIAVGGAGGKILTFRPDEEVRVFRS